MASGLNTSYFKENRGHPLSAEEIVRSAGVGKSERALAVLALAAVRPEPVGAAFSNGYGKHKPAQRGSKAISRGEGEPVAHETERKLALDGSTNSRNGPARRKRVNAKKSFKEVKRSASGKRSSARR